MSLELPIRPSAANDAPPEGRFDGVLVRENIAFAEVVHVFGELDVTSASELYDAIEDAARTGTTVVVDLEPCRYLDSSTLSVLTRASHAYAGRFLILVPAHCPARRLFAVTSLLELLPVIGSLDASIADVALHVNAA